MNSPRIILGLLLVLALFSTSRLSYLVLYGMAVFLGLCLWGSGRAFARIQAVRCLSGCKAFVGQSVTVTIKASNGSRFPLGWVSLSTSRQPNLVAVGPIAKAGLMPGRGSIVLTYQVVGVRRGYYPLGEFRLAGGDPLGWYPLERIIADPGDALIVFPPVTTLARLALPNVLPFGRQKDRLRAHEDPTHLGGIRDYQPGDSLRRVHWKATASLGRLQVKELVPTVTAASLILLNLGEAEYPAGSWTSLGELGVETAASLIVHLARLDTAVGLATNGRDPLAPGRVPTSVPPAAGAGQAETLLTILARIEVAPGPDFAELVRNCGRGATWGTNLFLITPTWHEELSCIALALKKAGKVPRPFLVGAGKGVAAARAAGLIPMAVSRGRDRGGVRIAHGG